MFLRYWADTLEGQSVNFGWQLLWESSEGLGGTHGKTTLLRSEPQNCERSHRCLEELLGNSIRNAIHMEYGNCWPPLYLSVRTSNKFPIQKSSCMGSPSYNEDFSYSQWNRKPSHQILGRKEVELNVTADWEASSSAGKASRGKGKKSPSLTSAQIVSLFLCLLNRLDSSFLAKWQNEIFQIFLYISQLWMIPDLPFKKTNKKNQETKQNVVEPLACTFFSPH